jgi:1-acyl-sn-glycerol-3-phosphate acyltransferase
VAFDSDRLDARDPELIRRVLPIAHAINARYLRLSVRGLEHVKEEPILFVSNHNGGIAGPDLCCTLATLWQARGPDAPLYAMAHDFAMRQLPPLGRVLQRFGALRASPRNAQRVLSTGGQLLVYPGGDLDAYRASRERDRVIFGNRSGFARIARASGVSVVPIVAHGAHRSAWVLDDGAAFARSIGLPRWGRLERFPIALALPWGLALGPWIPYLPLPFPVTLEVLAPMSVEEDESDDAFRDRVRDAMQAALDRMAAEAR